MKPYLDADEKICSTCGVSKPLSEYHPNKICKDGHVGQCKECANKKVRAWLKRTRQIRRDRINQRNQRVKQEVVDYFGNKCHDCGCSFPNCVYDFHHVDGKDANLSQALTWKAERMWKELEKCIMVCANCHRIRHYGEPK